LQSEWTDSQWEAIYYYEKKGTYKKAAEELNIAFQNVEKRCKAAKWKEIKFAEKSINKIIKNFVQEGDLA
ncbi:MAG: SatD, partial [Nanoarchaeota archaeon]